MLTQSNSNKDFHNIASSQELPSAAGVGEEGDDTGAAELGEFSPTVACGHVGHRKAMEFFASLWLQFASRPAAALPDPSSQYTLYGGLW